MKTIYISKQTGEKMSYSKLYDETMNNFETYNDWNNWVKENFEEREIFVESPYERTRRAVYSTGNKWAIENFNATH